MIKSGCGRIRSPRTRRGVGIMEVIVHLAEKKVVVLLATSVVVVVLVNETYLY